MAAMAAFVSAARHGVSLVLLVMLSISIVYSILALLRVAFFRLPEKPDGTFTPPVTLLKPVCGLEPEPVLYDCLRSFCEQDYPSYQIIFGVRRPDDPAVAVIERLLRDTAHPDASLIVDGRVYGANRKLSNLTNMYEAARHDILVSADADGWVGPEYLRSVVAPFANSEVGALTCLYVGKPQRGVWSALGADFMSDVILPSALMALALGKLRFLFGNTMAVRREVLEEIGGFRGLTTYLADDYLIGRRVSDRGLDVRLASYVVRTVISEPGLSSLFAHELRWGRTFRTVRPVGWTLSVLTDTTVLALLFLLVSGGQSLAVGLFAAAAALRLGLHKMVRRRFGIEGPDPLWLVPVRDVLTFAVRIASLFGRSLVWKKERFFVVSSGHIETEGSPPS
ncbi:MAG TPA: bacteriohopanetetrol glucosamine biosynthesis glycosyltransferase HpnI [Thermoanaerobaculia bacterium]|nr:bacteriohopanetetrol glucosamine biosynthesis glycosyltransferase HpnI [Thermoanaerobaculia bacterium]